MLAAQKEYNYSKNNSVQAHKPQQKILVEHRSKAISEPVATSDGISTASKAKSRLGIFLHCSILMALCIAVLLGYAKVTKLNYEIKKLDQEISTMSEESQRIDVVLDQIDESEWVSNYANLNLGMVYPEETQVIEIEIPKETEKNQNDYERNKTLVGSKFSEYIMDSILKMTKTY